MQNIITIDLGGVNAYLLEREGSFLLVDTGGHMFMDKEYDDRSEKLMKALEQAGVTQENLKLILLTHGDNDHVCNAKLVHDKFGAPIAMNEKDVFMVETNESSVYRINSNYESVLLRFIFKIMNKKIELLMEKVYHEFKSFSPKYHLSEGDDLSKYGFEGIIHETPGHTKGSISILDDEGNLIAGDLFANNKKPSLAPNAEDFDEMRKSASRMLDLGAKRIYPGHGEVYEVK